MQTQNKQAENPDAGKPQGSGGYRHRAEEACIYKGIYRNAGDIIVTDSGTPPPHFKPLGPAKLK